MHNKRLANRRQTRIHKCRRNDSHVPLKVATNCCYIHRYAKQDLSGRGLTGKTTDKKILFRAIGDPYSKQLHEAKGFVKEVKNHINCVSTGYILQKPLGTL